MGKSSFDGCALSRLRSQPLAPAVFWKTKILEFSSRSRDDGDNPERVTNEWELTEYRGMLVIIRDRVQDMIKNGATLDQVKAARLTAGFDVRFGQTAGPWTMDMFVEAVYTSLKNPPQTPGGSGNGG